MNLSKAKLLLDKINRLYNSMSLDEDNVAGIEKDLMRDYVRQLYEVFLLEESAKEPTVPVRRKPYKPPVVNIRPKTAAPSPPPFESPVEKPRVAQTPPKVVASPPPVTSKQVESPRAAPVNPTPSATPPSHPSVKPAHNDLFDVAPKSNELSEKLSQTRIADLGNAMGLNEKIFTVNELFGADNAFYRNVIRDLNGMQSFEEAKAYLSNNVADKFNWTDKSRRNKAKNFIKLVRRRYL